MFSTFHRLDNTSFFCLHKYHRRLLARFTRLYLFNRSSVNVFIRRPRSRHCVWSLVWDNSNFMQARFWNKRPFGLYTFSFHLIKISPLIITKGHRPMKCFVCNVMLPNDKIFCKLYNGSENGSLTPFPHPCLKRLSNYDERIKITCLYFKNLDSSSCKYSNSLKYFPLPAG